MEKEKQNSKKRGLGRGIGSLLGQVQPQPVNQSPTLPAQEKKVYPVPVEPKKERVLEKQSLSKPLPKEEIDHDLDVSEDPSPVEPLSLKAMGLAKAEKKKLSESTRLPVLETIEVDGPSKLSESNEILDTRKIWNLPIEKVIPNPNQPRTHFDPERLEELKNSIAEKGVLQPIIVQQSSDGATFMIIAGERRWRAAQLAGLHTLPAILKTFDAQELLEVALIENIQRHDLSAIEEARAYQVLIELHDLTQEQVASRVGKQRSTVANALRLLALHPDIQNWLQEGKLSMGHARALVAIPDKVEQVRLAKMVIRDGLSVRDVEKLVASRSEAGKVVSDPSTDVLEQKLIKRLEGELQKILSRKVKIQSKNSKGTVGIHFYSIDELNRIVKVLADGWTKRN